MRHLAHSKRFGTGVALFVAGLVFFGFAVYEFNVGRQLERDAVQADATIINKRETTNSKGRKHRRVDLRFLDITGQEQTMTHSSSKLWRRSIGDTVPIVYLRDDPTTTRLLGENKLGGYIVAGVFFTLVGLGFGLPPVFAASRASTSETQ